MVILKLSGAELFIVQEEELVDCVGAIVSHLERPNSFCSLRSRRKHKAWGGARPCERNPRSRRKKGSSPRSGRQTCVAQKLSLASWASTHHSDWSWGSA